MSTCGDQPEESRVLVEEAMCGEIVVGLRVPGIGCVVAAVDEGQAGEDVGVAEGAPSSPAVNEARPLPPAAPD